MRRFLVGGVTLSNVVLACGVRNARAQPPGVEVPAASSSDSIREFREGWGMLGNTADMDHEEYEALIARMEWLVAELARAGEAGRDVLFIHLRTPTQPVIGPGRLVRTPYTRVKIAIADAAARLGLRQAIPALAKVVVAVEPARDPLAFWGYRRLSVAAADALATLDGREALPALRDAFDFAFVRFRGASSAPMLHHLPAALVALGDNAWLEDRLIAWLESEDLTSRGQAAFLSQHTLGEKLVPHLIAHLRESGDPKAVWALRKISGEEYPGLASWEAWWVLNAATPRERWTGLPPTPAWRQVWAGDLFETMQTQFLCDKVLCWRRAGGGGAAAPAALALGRRVHALGIESSIVERLREQLVNDSEASCCRFWSSARYAAASRTVPPEPDPYCGCGRQLPMAFRDSVATQAERLLNAIACVEEPAPCVHWKGFDLSMKVAAAAAAEPEAQAPAGSAGRSDAPVGTEPSAPAGLRWRLAQRTWRRSCRNPMVAIRSEEREQRPMAELKRNLDYSDLQVTPDDGKRYELVRGGILVTPSPSPVHQRISKRLQRQLEDFFETRSLGEVFAAPIDLILTEQDVFVPDLAVVSDPSHLSKRGIEAPPALIVEILSPSTRGHDRGLKARRYAELGVEHYWIVDPEHRRLECHRLVEGVFRPLVDADGDATLEHPVWDGLVVDLTALWG